MKPRTKTGWIAATLLIASMVLLVEFNKFMKRRVPACENGVCAVPADYTAAKVTGPQTVPLMLSSRSAAEKPRPKLMDFGDGQSADCKMMDVVLDELAQATDGKLMVQYIDSREQDGVTEQYRIQRVPAQIFFDSQGNEMFRHEGFMTKDDILKKWAELGIALPVSKE